MRGLRGENTLFHFLLFPSKGKEGGVGEGTSLALRTKMRSTLLALRSKNQFTLFPSVEWLKPLKNA